MKGIRCEVLVSSGSEPDSCTRGPSAYHVELTLVGEGIRERDEVTADAPAVRIDKREHLGVEGMRVVPVDPVPPGRRGYQFGGNWVWLSPHNGFPVHYPLPIHDRTEAAG